MKPVTSYESFDGSLFKTARECADYEKHCESIATIIDKLPRFERTEEFGKGRSYFQHDRREYIDIRSEFFAYMDSVYPSPDFRLQIGEPCWIKSPIQYMDDIARLGDRALLLAWYYIGCVDNRYRQWSTPFAAANPPENYTGINE